MLRAKILRVDGSMLLNVVEIHTQNAKRGSGDGIVWRGSFTVPPVQLRPTLGETLILIPEGGSAVSAVVMVVEESEIHFRAPGRAPAQRAVEVRTESALAPSRSESNRVSDSL